MSNTLSKALPEAVEQVLAVLRSSGLDPKLAMLGDGLATSRQVADALGAEPGQLARCTVFRRRSDDAAVLVIISGDRRIDEQKLAALVCHDGRRIGRADAEFVQASTGSSLDGVSPLAHASAAVTLLDRSLYRFDDVWAPAGHRQAVCRLMPQELELLTGAAVVDVAVDLEEEETTRRQAHNLLAARARAVDAAGDRVPSPCISVCRISADTGLCEGCYRSLREISAWSRSGPDAQRLLWKAIGQRMATVRD
ncbi:MAG: hypothetical protein JWR60_162 [Polaromonas sp.]|nr:hypothetical protein [Polaromonas sp.]